MKMKEHIVHVGPNIGVISSSLLSARASHIDEP